MKKVFVAAFLIFILMGCVPEEPEPSALNNNKQDERLPLSEGGGKEKSIIQNSEGMNDEINADKPIMDPQTSDDGIAAETENHLPFEGQREENFWSKRVSAALDETPSPRAEKQDFPSTSYQGPLIDTHLHIPAIPDWGPEEELSPTEVVPEGRFGGPQALLGWNVKMSEIACTLMREGTHKNFAFFPVYEGEISLYLLEIWNKTMAAYPGLFSPFIMASGNDNEPDGFPTADAGALQEMLAVFPGLFQGYGEIGLYAREGGGSPELPPDAKRLLEIYPLMRQNKLVVYFHLGDGHKDNFKKILEQNPDITFIWHGDQLSIEEVSEILGDYPNAYFGIDEFFGGEREIFEKYVGKKKDDYLHAANKKFDHIVQRALRDFKALIERHPDQVMWGTDRGDAVWNYDVDVGQMQVKLARAFIGQLSPGVQEKFAYKNAERVVGER